MGLDVWILLNALGLCFVVGAVDKCMPYDKPDTDPFLLVYVTLAYFVFFTFPSASLL